MDNPLDDAQTLREVHELLKRQQERQRGVTPEHEAILEGVYELERRPQPHTELRLAAQLDLDVLAVKAWFRARRLRTQRIRNADVTAGLACFILSIAIPALGYVISRAPPARYNHDTGF